MDTLDKIDQKFTLCIPPRGTEVPVPFWGFVQKHAKNSPCGDGGTCPPFGVLCCVRALAGDIIRTSERLIIIQIIRS